MAQAGDDELERLLEEQAAYYHALGGSYLEQGLDLPGGDELAEALEAFRPAGSSSPTTHTAPPMNSCTARRHRSSAAGSRTARPTSW